MQHDDGKSRDNDHNTIENTTINDNTNTNTTDYDNTGDANIYMCSLRGCDIFEIGWNGWIAL